MAGLWQWLVKQLLLIPAVAANDALQFIAMPQLLVGQVRSKPAALLSASLVIQTPVDMLDRAAATQSGQHK
jgi:hypothetical protein